MHPATTHVVRRCIDRLLPQLDNSGFHITRPGVSSDTGRLLIGYDEPVDHIPDVLVDAVAAVTHVDVDFIHGGTISIAMFTPECLDASGPRRPKVTIEELVVAVGDAAEDTATTTRSQVMTHPRSGGETSPTHSIREAR